MAWLKSATRVEHEALETTFDVTNAGLTMADYVRYLQRFLGYYAPLERRLAANGLDSFDLTPRLKAHRLACDLRVLGAAPAGGISLCGELPPLSSPAQHWGCLYVLEGATLGGQVISRLLGERLHITPQSGCSFFWGYGAQTGPMWKIFRAALEDYASSASTTARDEIVASAVTTFCTLRNWLAQEGLSS
jgi:heme oxygenase